MLEVKAEEFQEWCLHPVTKALKLQYAADMERLKNSWAGGAFEGNAVLDAKVRGQCEVLSQFVALEFEDITGDK